MDFVDESPLFCIKVYFTILDKMWTVPFVSIRLFDVPMLIVFLESVCLKYLTK